MASDSNVAPTGTVNSATRYQRTETRQRTLRRARSTTPSRPERAGDHEGAETDTERPSQDSVQRQVERQDIGIGNRTDRRRQEADPETDHHKRHHRMASDAAEQSRHQCILSPPSLVIHSCTSIRRS